MVEWLLQCRNRVGQLLCRLHAIFRIFFGACFKYSTFWTNSNTKQTRRGPLFVSVAFNPCFLSFLQTRQQLLQTRQQLLQEVPLQRLLVSVRADAASTLIVLTSILHCPHTLCLCGRQTRMCTSTHAQSPHSRHVSPLCAGTKLFLGICATLMLVLSL